MITYSDLSEYENAGFFTEAVEEFNNWWTLTPAVQQLWQRQWSISWKTEAWQSTAWDYFIEIAILLFDSSHVYCKDCQTLLQHPVSKQHETRDLHSHLQSRWCIFKEDSATSENTKIDSFFSKNNLICYEVIYVIIMIRCWLMMKADWRDSYILSWSISWPVY